ncbi:hypothetical protein SAMN05216525_101111 [Bradyrhizobium sp. Gha]|nr:hypothetical protein SAMN05216525_101111 [Bradyrhizobium sp. Gha]
MELLARGEVVASIDDMIGFVEIRRGPNNFFDVGLIERIAEGFELLAEERNCRAIVLASEGSRSALAQISRKGPAAVARARGVTCIGTRCDCLSVQNRSWLPCRVQRSAVDSDLRRLRIFALQRRKQGSPQILSSLASIWLRDYPDAAATDRATTCCSHAVHWPSDQGRRGGFVGPRRRHSPARSVAPCCSSDRCRNWRSGAACRVGNPDDAPQRPYRTGERPDRTRTGRTDEAIRRCRLP